MGQIHLKAYDSRYDRKVWYAASRYRVPIPIASIYITTVEVRVACLTFERS